MTHVFYQLFDPKMADGYHLCPVPKLNKYQLRQDASINDRKLTWLKGKYYIKNPTMRFMLVTFQYYCICWMSQVARTEIKQNYDDESVWVWFRDRIQRQDQENLLYLMLSIIIEKKKILKLTAFIKPWAIGVRLGKKSFLLKKKLTQLFPHLSLFFIIKYSKTTYQKHHIHVNMQNMKTNETYFQ